MRRKTEKLKSVFAGADPELQFFLGRGFLAQNERNTFTCNKR